VHSSIASLRCLIGATQRLLELKASDPKSRLVGGNTELGIDAKFKGVRPSLLLSTASVPELHTLDIGEKGLVVGAAVTLSRLQERLERALEDLPNANTRGFCAVLDNLRWFAGDQIRGVATLAGNLVNASPISDLRLVCDPFVPAHCSIALSSPIRSFCRRCGVYYAALGVSLCPIPLPRIVLTHLCYSPPSHTRAHHHPPPTTRHSLPRIAIIALQPGAVIAWCNGTRWRRNGQPTRHCSPRFLHGLPKGSDEAR
jgi:hypothetical protein